MGPGWTCQLKTKTMSKVFIPADLEKILKKYLYEEEDDENYMLKILRTALSRGILNNLNIVEYLMSACAHGHYYVAQFLVNNIDVGNISVSDVDMIIQALIYNAQENLSEKKQIVSLLKSHGFPFGNNNLKILFFANLVD